MTTEELFELIDEVKKIKAEHNRLELKCANHGMPERLYDTLSAFSNSDEGGIILFGIDEKNEFRETGVYDAQDLQKHVVEQCNQMEPKVRAVFTCGTRNGLTFVAAEIPGIDVAERPCYYRGTGILKGSYIRVGDTDQHMSEYEIYTYEAYRKKYQDDIRVIERATLASLDGELLSDYLKKRKNDRPNFAKIDDETIYELIGVLREGKPTLAAVMLFGSYPQAYFPQLCITAIVVPGEEVGDVGISGERFIDNKRIEGTIPEMLDEAMAFVRKNIRFKTIIDDNGNRIDKPEYPLAAVREAILNALIHRDYSIHTEGKPIQLIIYSNRLEIKNPGGLYGRMRLDQLGKVQPDTRNPVIAFSMEIMKKTENRYSGIPTIRRALAEWGLPEPEFRDERGSFSVCFYNEAKPVSFAGDILEFCKTPKTRQEIAEFYGLKTVPLVMKKYVNPLLEAGLLQMLYPEKPRSSKQKFKTKDA